MSCSPWSDCSRQRAGRRTERKTCPPDREDQNRAKLLPARIDPKEVPDALGVEEISVATIGAEQRDAVVRWIAQMAIQHIRSPAVEEVADDR